MAGHPPDCRLVQAYGRAIDLDPARLFSLVQSGIILLSLGNASAGLERHRQALAAAPAHVPALCGAAETLLALAKMHSTQGATGEHVQAYCSWTLTYDGREGSSVHITCIVHGAPGVLLTTSSDASFISMGLLDTDNQLLMPWCS